MIQNKMKNKLLLATELRIGNYVYNEFTREEMQVYPITIHQLSKIGSTNIKPINLTEEWLLKFGFEKVGSNYETRLIILHVNNKTGTFDFLLKEPNSNKLIVRVIEHVHQLQNLYFALINEELTFKS